MGTDDPSASLHILKPDEAPDVRIEKQFQITSADDDIGNITFYGKGAPTSPSAASSPLIGLIAELTSFTYGAEAARLSFRTALGGTYSVVWHLGQGLYSHGATTNPATGTSDCGLQTINVGNSSVAGYYFAGKKAVGKQKSGYTGTISGADRTKI